MIDQTENTKLSIPTPTPGLSFFVFAYWHDTRFKSKAGGPMKVYEMTQNLTKRGHRVYLFIPKIGYPERQTTSQVCSVPFIDLPVLRFVSFQVMAFLWAFRIALCKDSPDIVYVRIMWSFLPMVFGRLFSVPVMLEINDSPHRAYDSTENFFKRTVVHHIDKISFHMSDHILPVNQKIAQEMHTLEGIPWEKLTVLPSGTNIDLFYPMDKLPCCRKLGFDESSIYIGFIGTLFAYQGIDLLIKAAPAVIQRHPRARFLILGDGPMKDAWQAMTREHALESYFIFPGHVPYENVPSYCAMMDVCVAPFHRSAGDSSGVKIFDYLACGKPVVATDVGESSTFFAGSGAVMLVSPANPAALAQGLNHLLEDEALREEMGSKGRTFITSRYSRAQIAETVEKIAMRILMDSGKHH